MAELVMDVEDNNEVVAGKTAPCHLPWVEKYRPSSLDDLIAHEDIIKILNQLIDNNKLPHLLFYGPPGTGSTHNIVQNTLSLNLRVLTHPPFCVRQNIYDHCLCQEDVW
ncbi:hypothetical protein EON65_37260 [archaeon]|nr:MAG: hypothetical protein EON65_37260 [archaeon]